MSVLLLKLKLELQHGLIHAVIQTLNLLSLRLRYDFRRIFRVYILILVAHKFDLWGKNASGRKFSS